MLSMRGRAAITASALVICVSLISTRSVAATRHHTAPSKCLPGHRQILAADAQAQVYTRQRRVRVANRATPEIAIRTLTDAVACAYGQRRTYDLGKVFGCERGEVGEPEECGGVDQEVVAGPTVAYELRTPGPFNDSFVIVRDLRTGRILHREPTGAGKGESEGIGATKALVVKSDGSVAWTVKVYENAVYEVHAADTTGSRMLASGADIDPTSLALAGSTIYWTQGGRPYSATLN
jgi:hypothetical protein